MDAFAPSGLPSWDGRLPTAYAVGYILSPLRGEAVCRGWDHGIRRDLQFFPPLRGSTKFRETEPESRLTGVSPNAPRTPMLTNGPFDQPHLTCYKSWFCIGLPESTGGLCGTKIRRGQAQHSLFNAV